MIGSYQHHILYYHRIQKLLRYILGCSAQESLKPRGCRDRSDIRGSALPEHGCAVGMSCRLEEFKRRCQAVKHIFRTNGLKWNHRGLKIDFQYWLQISFDAGSHWSFLVIVAQLPGWASARAAQACICCSWCKSLAPRNCRLRGCGLLVFNSLTAFASDIRWSKHFRFIFIWWNGGGMFRFQKDFAHWLAGTITFNLFWIVLRCESLSDLFQTMFSIKLGSFRPNMAILYYLMSTLNQTPGRQQNLVHQAQLQGQ